MQNDSSAPSAKRAVDGTLRAYAKPGLKRFGTLAEVTKAVGNATPNADGGMDVLQKTS